MNQNDTAMISLQNVKLRLRRDNIQKINVDVHAGDIIAVIGPSGSGKTTLLRAINLLLKPNEGKVLIDGQDLMDPKTDIYSIRRRIGMVFQSFTLFSHKTLIDNVMMGPMDLLGVSKQQAYEDGKKYLQMVGLGEELFAFPDKLSGGQKQRGEIARCLAMKPEILLLDDPISALDSIMAAEVQAVINRLAGEGLTMMVVTNDLQFCQNIANRVFFMEDGYILEDGTPEQVFHHPKHKATRNFVQQMRSFTYIIESKDFDLYELNARIEAFARDYFLSKKIMKRIELIIEELIINNLLAHTENIEIGIRYFETSDRLLMKIHYSGESFNPFDTDREDDVLAMLVVQQMTKDVDYSFGNRNHLRFWLK